MIEIHLYGRLRRYGPTTDIRSHCVVVAPPDAALGSVGDVLARLDIPHDQVASVFADGRWRRAGLESSLAGVSRLGLFPPEMSLLYV